MIFPRPPLYENFPQKVNTALIISAAAWVFPAAALLSVLYLPDLLLNRSEADYLLILVRLYLPELFKMTNVAVALADGEPLLVNREILP